MILVIGDSFSYGSELPDTVIKPYAINNTKMDPLLGHHDPRILPPASKFAWPELLAKKLNDRVDNLSIPGGSNSRIFRLALNASIQRSYNIIICAWTEIARLDLQYEEVDFPVTANSRWYFERFPWLNDYFRYHYNDNQAYQTWICQVMALQNHFKQINQRFIFTNLITQEHLIDVKRVDHLNKRIDKNHFIDWPLMGMVNWMGDCDKGPGGHPLELGHERIAERIYEHIRSLSWLS